MNWFLSIVIIIIIFALLYWAIRERSNAEAFKKKYDDIKTEKSKLSNSIRQKGNELTSAENKIRRLEDELDEK